VHGVLGPTVVLALPFIGLNAAAHLLYRRDRKAVAVAFYLAAVGLLPLFLLIVFHETGLLVVAPGTPGQLFDDGSVSNRQLQITTAAACAWSGWLALRTRTVALSSVFTVLSLLLTMAIAADFGLRNWIDHGRWDRVAFALVPLLASYAAVGALAERARRAWLSRPLYLGTAILVIAILELLALDGRAFHYLGFSLATLHERPVTDPVLLDTLAAMTLNGFVFYLTASAIARRGSTGMHATAAVLFSVAPFALLHPLGYLVRTHEYSLRFDWLYCACAAAIVLVSERRQRRSFFYAGLLNLGIGLYHVADHRQWFARPAWAIALVVVGLAALAVGFTIDRQTRRNR